MNQTENKKKELEKIINLLNVKKYDAVVSKAKILVKKFPNDYIFYNALGMALMNLGQFDESLKILNKAIKLDDKNIHVLNNLGLAHSSIANYQIANEYYNRALKIKPDFLNALINLANLKEKLNLNIDAIEVLKIALKHYPDDYFLHYTIGTIYQFLGDFKKSHFHYQKSLSINPSYTEIYRLMSMTKKFQKGDEDIEIIKNKINDKNLAEIKKMHLYFALGKAFDDTKDFNNSFINYKMGNDIKDKFLKFNFNLDEKILSSFKKNFEEQSNNLSLELNSDKKIIFIIGMPRSGTSLIEQVLSAHDDVAGAGELTFLTDAIYKEFFSNPNEFDITKITKEKLKKIQTFYLDRINQLNYSEKYIVDKAPLNFKWTGFIKMIFPNSYIVNCNRDPMDICWSNYKQYYSSSNLGFAYNLKKLGQFYNLYNEYMTFWEKILREKNLLNIQYENFTENFQDEVKKLLSFCDLSWSTKCVEFYKSKNSVSTASLAQVRQPIYKTSVAAWESYSSYLEDLKNSLKN